MGNVTLTKSIVLGLGVGLGFAAAAFLVGLVAKS